MKFVRRILLMPLGLLKNLLFMANDGARDLENKRRYPEAIIDRNCCFTSDSVLGTNSRFYMNATVNSSSIGSYTICANNTLIQNAAIGRYSSIAGDVVIGLGAHPTDLFSTSCLFYRINNPLKYKLADVDYLFDEHEPIEIGNDVWIGARALVLNGIKIGNGAVVAAGAIVTKDVPPYAIVGGVPAKIIRYRFNKNTIDKLSELQWWDWTPEEIKIRQSELNEYLSL